MIAVLAAGVEEVLDAAAPCASDEDRAAAARRNDRAHQRQTLAGRTALRLLAAWGRGAPIDDASSFEITRACSDCAAPHGQPRSADLALTSSTTLGRVLVAIADPNDALGVDIEVVPAALWPNFDDSVLHVDEAAALPPIGVPSAITARIDRWTAKEAALKASGVGLRTSPSTVLTQRRCEDASPWREALGAPHAGTPSQPIVVRALPLKGRARASLATSRAQDVRIFSLQELLAAFGCLPDSAGDAGELAHLLSDSR